MAIGTKATANPMTVLGDCLPTTDSSFTPSDVGRALAACDELVASAKQMARLAKGPTGLVKQEDKRATIARMEAALAPFGGAE